MQELLNIHFGYLCRATHKTKDGTNPIVLRVIFRKERRDIFTVLYCHKKHWDKKNSKVGILDEDAGTLNRNLDLIMRKANHAFDELKLSGNTFTLDELVDKIKARKNGLPF
jgi:hypothetical protein